MKILSITLVFLGLVLVAMPAIAAAQIDQQCPHIEPLLNRHNRQDRAASKSIREQLIKLCIKENKKEFERLVERTEEIAQLTEEIKVSFDESKTLSEGDREKLEKVQSLVKKVRKDLGADEDDEDKELPQDAVEAMQLLHQSATNLLSEIKKTTRHTISLVAIKSSNTVMKIVKFLRFGN